MCTAHCYAVHTWQETAADASEASSYVSHPACQTDWLPLRCRKGQHVCCLITRSDLECAGGSFRFRFGGGGVVILFLVCTFSKQK